MKGVSFDSICLIHYTILLLKEWLGSASVTFLSNFDPDVINSAKNENTWSHNE